MAETPLEWEKTRQHLAQLALNKMRKLFLVSLVYALCRHRQSTVIFVVSKFQILTLNLRVCDVNNAHPL